MFVSKPYEGRVHDFNIRKKERPLPAVPILADLGYQGLQNIHPASVFIPEKKPKNGSLNDNEKAENKQLACRRIAIGYVIGYLILAARYRGLFVDHTQIFQTIAGLHNFLLAG